MARISVTVEDLSGAEWERFVSGGLVGLFDRVEAPVVVTSAPPTVEEPTLAFVAKVERDALGGDSPVWRPMLRYLADHRGEWVNWKAICAAMERTPAQMAGALGAAERRCGPPLPYEKVEAHAGIDHQFRMSEAVAQIIDQVLPAVRLEG